MIKFNNKELTKKVFPNGESLIDGEEIMSIHNGVVTTSYTRPNNILELTYENDSDLMNLMFVKRFLDTRSDRDTFLRIKYMPYSRMDRVEGDSVFTLKYVCDFINSLNFKHIYVHEAHSDVCLALLNNAVNIDYSVKIVEEIMKDINFNPDTDYIYYPDATAHRRYSKKLKGRVINELVGLKKRNFKTGQLDSLEVVGSIPQDKANLRVIMIDDLCSFGGTFQWGAEELASLGFTDIYLAVTHCENSIFKGKIFNSSLINCVYTSNSMIRDRELETEMIQTGRIKLV